MLNLVCPLGIVKKGKTRRPANPVNGLTTEQLHRLTASQTTTSVSTNEKRHVRSAADSKMAEEQMQRIKQSDPYKLTTEKSKRRQAAKKKQNQDCPAEPLNGGVQPCELADHSEDAISSEGGDDPPPAAQASTASTIVASTDYQIKRTIATSSDALSSCTVAQPLVRQEAATEAHSSAEVHCQEEKLLRLNGTLEKPRKRKMADATEADPERHEKAQPAFQAPPKKRRAPVRAKYFAEADDDEEGPQNLICLQLDQRNRSVTVLCEKKFFLGDGEHVLSSWTCL